MRSFSRLMIEGSNCGNTETPKPPAPPAGQDRAEFNGELSHMAQMVIMHLWGHMRWLKSMAVTANPCHASTSLWEVTWQMNATI